MERYWFWIRTLRIVRSSQYVGNGKVITKEPKTQSGIRNSFKRNDMPAVEGVPQMATDDHCKPRRQMDRYGKLFTTWNGNPIYPDTVTFHGLQVFWKGISCGRLRLHSLDILTRLLWLLKEWTFVPVSKRLGHANTSTTLNYLCSRLWNPVIRKLLRSWKMYYVYRGRT